MKEKCGNLDVQQALGMKYTNDRVNYPDISDAEYANAHSVSAGMIASGVLHRSSSPFNHSINRDRYVSEYMEKEGIKTVLNLTDTEEDMMTYDMADYLITYDKNKKIITFLKLQKARENKQ